MNLVADWITRLWFQPVLLVSLLLDPWRVETCNDPGLGLWGTTGHLIRSDRDDVPGLGGLDIS